jgi:GTP-binding protein
MKKNTDPLSPSGLPVVSVVGRPNVGKSALFNRLLGKRLAIVHEECGVTRDRLIARAVWDDKPFELVDTGGLSEFGRQISGNILDAGTRRQSESAIEDASIVILVTDAEAGLNPLDEAVARMIRQKGVRAIVAANKCDSPHHDSQSSAFDSLGFPVFSVSALHNRGIEELMDEVTAEWKPVSPDNKPTPLRVTVVGKPNVGKSSFLNRLVRQERLIVSDIPGTTRDIIDIPFQVGEGASARHYLLTDTAGMRRMGKVDGAVERYSVFRAESSISKADVVVLMIDATQGPTSQDKAIANTIIDAHKGCVVIINKWDLLKGHSTEKEYREALSHAIQFLKWVPFVFVSSKDGFNINRCLDIIDHVARQVQTQIPTGLLNRVFTEAVERVQPPMLKGKRFKIYYATQTTNNPIQISLFVNDPTRLTDAYREYLMHALRNQFGLEGAPILLSLKERPRQRFVPQATPRKRHRAKRKSS